MAVLSNKTRNKLKSSTFGIPGERKYPMPDRSHAANAKARATQMVNAGKLSKEEKKKIDAKANKILAKTAPKTTKPAATKRVSTTQSMVNYMNDK